MIVGHSNPRQRIKFSGRHVDMYSSNMTKSTSKRLRVESTSRNKSFKSLLQKDSAIDPNLALLFACSIQPVTSSANSFGTVSHNVNHQTDTYFEHKNASKIDIGNEIDDKNRRINEDDTEYKRKVEEKVSKISNHKTSQNEEIIQCYPEQKRKRKNSINAENKHVCKSTKQEKKDKVQPLEKFQEDCQNSGLTRHELGVLDCRRLDENESGDTGSIQVNEQKHESLSGPDRSSELEKALRTVFLANVSTLAISSKSAKKTLLAHMSSFLSDLPAPLDGTPIHKIESIRFRSTAYASFSIPKKVAFAKKKLMPATTQSTNAYVVYSSAYVAREAVKRLNGTIILNRHLRVDSVAHPSKIDHRRCVFVGNLGFIDDESPTEENNGKVQKKSRLPADIEEGLWTQFNKAGKVESVRVVRDGKTRVGKGFAYVQFMEPISVEAALLFNEKKFPPMLPRKLRVVRAKALRKTAVALAASHAKKPSNFPPNIRQSTIPSSSKQLSLYGRASNLLGHAGAASLKAESKFTHSKSRSNQQELDKKVAHKSKQATGNMHHKLPETFIFEGYRASSKRDRLRNTKPKNKSRVNSGKPITRSSKRASEWKKTHGTKPRKS